MRCGWTATPKGDPQYAAAIGEQIVRPLFPLVWEAFVDYRLEGMFLSRLERDVIRRLVERLAESGRGTATEEDFLAVQDPSWATHERCRERDECREKLASLVSCHSIPKEATTMTERDRDHAPPSNP